jgi:hypothetical protein
LIFRGFSAVFGHFRRLPPDFGKSQPRALTGGNNHAAYSYLANSPWVGQIAFANNGAVTMTTSKPYDYLNRLTGIASQRKVDCPYAYQGRRIEEWKRQRRSNYERG